MNTAVIEPAAAGWLRGESNPAMPRACGALHAELEQSIAAGDLVGASEADLAFHLLLAEICGNQPLRDAALAFRPHLAHSLRLPLAEHTRIGETAVEHQRITLAITAGDPPNRTCRHAGPSSQFSRSGGSSPRHQLIRLLSPSPLDRRFRCNVAHSSPDARGHRRLLGHSRLLHRAGRRACRCYSKAGVLKVAVPQDFPPFGTVGTDLKPRGYDIDVAGLIAADLGVSLS